MGVWDGGRASRWMQPITATTTTRTPAPQRSHPCRIFCVPPCYDTLMRFHQPPSYPSQFLPRREVTIMCCLQGGDLPQRITLEAEPRGARQRAVEPRGIHGGHQRRPGGEDAREGGVLRLCDLLGQGHLGEGEREEEREERCGDREPLPSALGCARGRAPERAMRSEGKALRTEWHLVPPLRLAAHAEG